MRLIFCLLSAVLALHSQPDLDFLNHGQPVLHAHNCYPEDGQWNDRVSRALASASPVAIEQDIAWGMDGKTPVVSHSDKTKGGEPSLRQHFFEAVRPRIEQALRENDRSRWPMLVLHFDFKSNDPALLRAVWDLLGEYESWITTAPKTADPHQLSPFDAKPILVLSEDADAQEEVFFRRLPPNARLRVFGSAHTARIEGSRQERAHLAVTLPPAQLLSEPATNFRRWWNLSWATVEEGGPPKAGAWTPTAVERLRSLVDHAHRLGYWIRFYTLDGFRPEESRGWNDSYNFGSRQAVSIRWKAAFEAGVNLIATDQYEDLAAEMKQFR